MANNKITYKGYEINPANDGYSVQYQDQKPVLFRTLSLAMAWINKIERAEMRYAEDFTAVVDHRLADCGHSA